MSFPFEFRPKHTEQNLELVKISYQSSASDFVYQNNMYWESLSIMPVFEATGDKAGEMQLLLFGPESSLREWVFISSDDDFAPYFEPDSNLTEREIEMYRDYIQSSPFSSVAINSMIDLELFNLMKILRQDWSGLWDVTQEICGAKLVRFLSNYCQTTELKRFMQKASDEVFISQKRNVGGLSDHVPSPT